MLRRYFLSLLLFNFIIIPCFKLNSQETFTSKEKTVDFTIRFGQGGFSDNRSDLGQLGGGQIALDVKLVKYPIALSLSGEYYTNSAGPTHPYEISDMNVVNVLYMNKPFRTNRINIFAGGGLGMLEVPKDNSEEKTHKGIVYDLEAGINIRAFWKIGFYGLYKYLYANKEVDNIAVIDFSEHIILLGITFNFSL